MKEQLQNIYDGFADTYEENRGLFDMTEVFASFYNGLDSDGGCLLDLGCGAGEPLARFFLDRGWQVTGVDFSSRMLELAGHYVPEMGQVAGDMREVQFDPVSFDAVAAVYSLFHVPTTDHRRLLANVLNWLKPGGRLLFTYATKEYTGEEEFDGYKEFMGQQLYYSHTRPEKLRKMLEEVGFTVVSFDYRDIGGEIFLWVTATKQE